jgi:CPA2 family monovalent cation:H+ antiporter-2
MLELLAELSLLVGASALIAYLGQRFFGIVPLVGFLLTGVLIGPNALGLVHDIHFVEEAAEIGVILLLFTIGIEFSLEKLARIRRLIFGGGSLQLVLAGGAVTGILLAFGVEWRAALYTGLLATLSSTVIALKLLADRGETGTPAGQATLGILLFQDLAVVVMVLLLPALAGEGGGAAGVAVALAKAAGIIVLVLVVARRVMPFFLERVAQACSPDIFLLTIVAICFGTAWLAAAVGIGVSLGAFLAGLIVSESEFSEHALSEILPLRILFSAAFFVSIGMLLDPAFILREPLLVAGVVVGIFVVKLLTTGLGLLALGTGTAVSASAALLLAQVGEFAFVLERSGAALGLYPVGSAETGSQAFIAATVILMIATPAFAALGPPLARRLEGRRGGGPMPAPKAPDPHATPRDHVIIGGFGDTARGLVKALVAAGEKPVILTLSPDGARAAEAEGHRVIRGDYARRHILELAGIHDARLLVVADDDVAMTERVVSVVRAIAPDLEILAQTRRVHEARELEAAGATRVVAAEGAADRELARSVLASAGADPDDIARVVAGRDPDGPGVSLDPEVLEARRCRHVDQVRTVHPRTPGGCEACMAEGRSWVHLRLCMTCGYVGCCDSSPGRHARAHFHGTGHPVVRSWEPGEDRAWCLEDDLRL